MFTSRYNLIIDEKGRISLPKSYREILVKLGNQIVITTFDGCLYVYPQEEWSKFAEKFYALPSGDREVRDFQRYILSHASECMVDRQGRILIPNSLRSVAQLEKEVVIVGRVKHFELWNKVYFDQTIARFQSNEPSMHISSIINDLKL